MQPFSHSSFYLTNNLLLRKGFASPSVIYNSESWIERQLTINTVTRIIIPNAISGPQPSSKLSFNIACKAQMYVQNEDGQRAGVLPTGEFVDEIGSAVYETQDDDGVTVSYLPELFPSGRAKCLTLRPKLPTEIYTIAVVGTSPSPFFMDVSLTGTAGVVINQSLPGGSIDQGVEWDYACQIDSNIGALNATFMAPTENSMANEINKFRLVGDICNDGIVTSLNAKLLTAQYATQRGILNMASGALNAFIHQVRALSGKQISLAAANDLSAHARYLLDHVGSH